MRHGEGTFEFMTGGVFKGNWKDDNADGIGTYKFASGAVYKWMAENFEAGEKDGSGS